MYPGDAAIGAKTSAATSLVASSPTDPLASAPTSPVASAPRGRRSRPTALRASLSSFLLAAVAVPGAFAQEVQRYRYIATPLTEFRHDVDPAMLLPTAVAVARDGTVFVADARDRILVFAADGTLRDQLHDVGNQVLSRPVSIKIGPAGELWIADTGNHRALVRAPDGSLARQITWPSQPSSERPANITDATPSPDGKFAWLVDNYNNRLARVDLASGMFTLVGKFGESLGQFYYPFMLATNAAGDVFVTESINGRVQILNAEGRIAGSLGEYGAGLGNLYRPKGIATDAAGNAWVVDGRLSVVQVFSPDRILLDVVRDEGGEPLKLDTPCGLALDSAGNMYVAELLPNRVRKFAVAFDPNAPPARPSARPRTGGMTQPRTCTVCHIEWLEPLARGESTPIMSPPASTRQRPAVSNADTCLSCHDGSVVDSRRRVWGEQGHKLDIAPGPETTVPASLPLVDGKIVCRTCHMAHTRGGAGESFAEAVFLRVKDSPAELCSGCHSGFDSGASAGMHPLGTMSVTVPASLTHNRKDSPSDRLTCLSCHAGHGALHEKLLVLSTHSNDLCLTCHQSLAPALFSEHTRSRHGRLPTLDAPQLAVAEGFGTRIGPDSQLLCTTCHAPHRAPTQRYLLAFDPAQQDTCTACHAAQRGLINSSHDLRTNFPQEQNLLGVSTEVGGPCSSCHTAHRYAQPASASPIDSRGLCVSCHAPDAIAAAKQPGTVNHPQAPCTACHNPHETRFGHYLSDQPTSICRTCHAEQEKLAGGLHDRTRTPSAWPAASTATNDRCLACHRPHGNEETGLFRAGRASGVQGPDGACIACHATSAPDAPSTIANLHPSAAPAGYDSGGLPLARMDDGQLGVACRTCHNPHADSRIARLLRIDASATSQQLCLTCHRERVNIRMIGHAPHPLQVARFDPAGCRPCHVVHADRQATESTILWPKSLSDYPGEPNVPIADHYCRACHREGGPVPPPAITTHPEAQMFNPDAPGAPGHLPLFNAQGQEDPTGRPGCRTCHLTHGRTTPAPLPPDVSTAGSRELRARAWHIRTFAATNVCTTCHGFDALRRFMYFHDPVRRAGPITPPAGVPAVVPGAG